MFSQYFRGTYFFLVMQLTWKQYKIVTYIVNISFCFIIIINNNSYYVKYTHPVKR